MVNTTYTKEMVGENTLLHITTTTPTNTYKNTLTFSTNEECNTYLQGIKSNLQTSNVSLNQQVNDNNSQITSIDALLI